MCLYQKAKKINKKGSLTAPIVDFWAIIVFIFLIILFYFVITFSVKEGKVEMENRAEALQANALLLSYLRTPITVDSRNIQMSELIIESYSRNNFDDFKIKSGEILKKLGKDVEVLIILPDDKREAASSGESMVTPERYLQASASLPTSDYEIIKVTIYWGLKNE